MTYCLGWKSETAVFLIADSAVTDIMDHKNNLVLPEKTTFGEQQGSIDGGKKYVYERALKLYSVGSISITFAGDTHVGNELIELIKDNLDLGYNIQKAINISLINYIDFSSYARVQMLIAYHEDKPELYSIDNKKSPYLNEVSDFMAFGSPPSGLREYSLVFYEAFKKSRETEKYATAADEIFLLRMLALLQSYGIHNYTIEKGIGGAYSGLYVTKNKAHWQPDMCYLILKARNDSNENLISSIYFRDNIKFIITDKINAAFSTF